MAEFAPSGDISKMLEQLMSDEKFGDILNAVKESISTNVDNGESEPTSKETEVVTEESPVPSIPKLSPELLAKLPEIMGMLSGDSGKKSDSRMNDRKRLLHALKPFLSENRRNAVDNIVNIAGIADLFGI